MRELRSLQPLRGLGIGPSVSATQEPPPMIRRVLDMLGSLELLESLSLSGLKLPALPEGIQRLRGLKRLTVAGCPLDGIPQFVLDLPLELLQLIDCAIREIPADILRMTRLKELNVERNLIESPPMEVVSQGLDAIRNYWRQREETGVDYLCEAKLIILGEPGAGKTSLAHKIENPNYKLRESEPSTEGIDVIRYRFPSAIRVEDGES